jgi:hypothetical protein
LVAIFHAGWVSRATCICYCPIGQLAVQAC